MMNYPAILKKYDELCLKPSDINELLPYLRKYAEKCSHITEMGVREPTSTYAFLAGKPKQLISYDLFRNSAVDEVEKLAPDNFKFILQDVLEVDIEETDFLFIDTYHTASQLEMELAKHAEKVRQYIGFHDTGTFWNIGEPPYEGMDTTLACGRGLKFALMPFIGKGEWRISFMANNNNGLLILERKNKNQLFSGQLITHLKYLFFIKYARYRNYASRLFK